MAIGCGFYLLATVGFCISLLFSYSNRHRFVGLFNVSFSILFTTSFSGINQNCYFSSLLFFYFLCILQVCFLVCSTIFLFFLSFFSLLLFLILFFTWYRMFLIVVIIPNCQFYLFPPRVWFIDSNSAWKILYILRYSLRSFCMSMYICDMFTTLIPKKKSSIFRRFLSCQQFRTIKKLHKKH